MPIHYVGGIAYQFEEEIKAATAAEGRRMGRIMRRPIESIVQFHLAER